MSPGAAPGNSGPSATPLLALHVGAAAAAATALLLACLAFDAPLRRLLAPRASTVTVPSAGGAAAAAAAASPATVAAAAPPPPLPPPVAAHLPPLLPAPACGSGYSSLIGHTRLIRLASLSRESGCEILAKCEFLNPGGSGKDRVALRAVEAAERAGALRPGGLLVEGTSGSTGISLALLARARGYRCAIFLPNDQAAEKAALLRRLGAAVVETPPLSIVNAGHYVNRARAAAAAAAAADAASGGGAGGALFVDQFDSPHNTAAHYEGTGPELWAQAGGRVDAFVCGAGTGGTLGGVGRYLKEASAGATRVHLVDPQGSVLLRLVNDGVAWAPELAERTLRRHRADTLVEGVGLDRVTANMAAALPYIDSAWGVSDAEAVGMARRLLAEEGLFLGSSSALNCVGALRAAAALGPGHTVVTLLCDGGARHLSRFWSDEVVAGVGRLRGDAALVAAVAGGAGGEGVGGSGAQAPTTGL
jgi:cysteine synthase A